MWLAVVEWKTPNGNNRDAVTPKMHEEFPSPGAQIPSQINQKTRQITIGGKGSQKGAKRKHRHG
jgi:hypothetical protein